MENKGLNKNIFRLTLMIMVVLSIGYCGYQQGRDREREEYKKEQRACYEYFNDLLYSKEEAYQKGLWEGKKQIGQKVAIFQQEVQNLKEQVKLLSDQLWEKDSLIKQHLIKTAGNDNQENTIQYDLWYSLMMDPKLLVSLLLAIGFSLIILRALLFLKRNQVWGRQSDYV